MEISAHHFSILGHPHRLALFRLLMRRYPDALAAGEICAALALKPSTASVYLAALRKAGLVVQEREGTSLRYCIDLGRARALVGFLQDDCCRGRPDLCAPESAQLPSRPLHVLFICTHNSARSIMAQAILRHLGQGGFVAHSAGKAAKAAPDARALDMLRAQAIETDGLYSKSVDIYRAPAAPQMDLVLTVCDRAANEECPLWDARPITSHWGVPSTGLTSAFTLLHRRVSALVALPLATLDKITLQRAVDAIAAQSESP
jgi:ArsR family transcriptional regulator, arsenate/arsenite/antimonite-responsive transcriptional repressor / arsenate reductase (thioredoxin)